MVWQEFHFWAMGTDNTVIIGDGPNAIDDMSTEDWVRKEIESLEQCWSRFRSDSELNIFLSTSGPQTLLSDALLLALDCAARLWNATDGLFDVRVRSHLEVLGYDRPFRALPHDVDGFRKAVASSKPRVVGAKPNSLHGSDPSSPGFGVDLVRRVAEVDDGVLLDFGGLGKGLAADLVTERLIQHGAKSVCVSLGGDIRTKGSGPHRGGWDIPINNPYLLGSNADQRRADDPYSDATRPDEVFVTHHSTDGAVVMSTVALRSWRNNLENLDTLESTQADTDRDRDLLHHHLIDPRTGRSSFSGVHSVVAAGAQAWWCEGAAKAALVAGPDHAIDLLERLGVDGWVFLDSGHVLTTALIS